MDNMLAIDEYKRFIATKQGWIEDGKGHILEL